MVIPVQLTRVIRLCGGESKESPDLHSDDADSPRRALLEVETVVPVPSGVNSDLSRLRSVEPSPPTSECPPGRQFAVLHGQARHMFQRAIAL